MIIQYILYLGATVLELGNLQIYDTFYKVSKPSLKDLQLRYMKTDNFIIIFTESNIHDEYMDGSNLDIPDKTNKIVPDKFKYEIGSKIIDEFIVLLSKTYSFLYCDAKEKKEYRNRLELNMKITIKP